MEFPIIDDATRLARLEPPTGKIDMVLDTDTYNEIDDQFAVTYAMLSPEQLNVEAIYAAPFHNTRSTGPGDGMEKSYDEILCLLERLGATADGFAFRGSTSWLPDAETPVASDAVNDLIARAKADREGPLYVVAIGAITNVASAILAAPEIIDRIVVVWLAGQPHYWHHAGDFNLNQDIHASRLIFECGVPFVHLPCKHVAQYLRSTVQELEAYVKGRGEIGDFLFERFCGYSDNHMAWAKEIWDLAPLAWLIEPEWTPSAIVHAPKLTDHLTWSVNPYGHLMRIVLDMNRNGVFGDLFRKLEAFAAMSR